MIRFYLVRHGETHLNETGVYYGWTDCELSESGINQCKILKNSFKDIKFDAVVSSPLIRAVKSAKLLSGMYEDSLVKDERLKELNFGKWEGMNYKLITEKYETEWEKWSNEWKTFCIPDGESFSVMYKRVKEFTDDILNQYKEGNILIVSHQGPLRVIASTLLNIGEDAYWHFAFENGKYSCFEIDHGHCTIRNINCI